MIVEPLGGAFGLAGVERVEDVAVLDDHLRQTALQGG
jgi:hypothetical protein